ncbi:MAG: RNA polymerase sigma factor [Actinomycetota bacterium]|nr:RNA polymerase sigma factor [Actinomycetota bacterium]
MKAHNDKITVDELQQLVRRAQSDDADAWEALYRLAYPALLAYARRRLMRRDEADDAVSETFVRAYSRIAGFHWEGAGFNAWLFGILRNVVLEAHRRDRRNDKRLMQGSDNDEDLLHDLLLDEEFSAVRRAFACLSPDDRELLELRVVGCLSAEEVAVVLGKRAGAIRMAQSRALSRLRTELAKGGGHG